ncbi:MAG: hypothetical protein ACTS5P_01835 [Candidatus Hodgkinia cicadicola]
MARRLLKMWDGGSGRLAAKGGSLCWEGFLRNLAFLVAEGGFGRRESG